MTAGSNGQSAVTRDEWIKWAGSLVIHIVVTVASTAVTNYIVLSKQVALLEAKLESQGRLWDVQFDSLSKQCDELKRDIHELRAPLKGMKFGPDAAKAAAARVDVSRYSVGVENRRKSLGITWMQRLPLWHCITIIQGPSRGVGTLPRGPGDCGFPALLSFF